ncbi:MAG TPA: hypothetical protein VIP57_17595 [Candidatus Dormibacteraeota bacterium]
MDPRFENLGAESFQRFCQSLISYEDPDVQALEVGQPDGGRDAFSRQFEIRGVEAGCRTYQVKFVRSPRPLKDPEKWVANIIGPELAKIKRLAEQGMSSYTLITNASGSAHLDSGAVDKVNAYLAESLPIPARCWWRNDLITRLAKHPELRWGYPDLLNAADVLRELIGSGLKEDSERRTSAIKAYLVAQYLSDKFVRFRQVDLQTSLLDVFVDVPAIVRGARSEKTQQLLRLAYSLSPQAHRPQGASASIGAADLLFHPATVSAVPRIVLEGAPGQGKSTLAQYLCQVHRMRLLRRTADLSAIPASHQLCPARLPFKIDLRDFAAFLQGRDPFEDDPEWGGMPPNQPRSLEGFLAALVFRHSGGAPFSVSDLQAVLRVSHLFIAFDGLDEVAEFDDRRVVIEAIKVGSERIEELALGLQTVVTSRPAAFTHSPGFSSAEVPHLQLIAMPKDLIVDYSKRWTRSRGLDPREGRAIERVLSSQLGQTHIRDLARNPMQLTILLTLILTKGESLPDKRTDLYTSYLNIFFDREAAKSVIVRKHRDVLVALHEFLAWQLHSAAESDSSGGTISEVRLKAEVKEYLKREDSDPALTDHLFKGMVERVLALVSRVQGRFEFEVQPLREYFAASYLYSTSQISELGDVRSGTLLDRFDGLARNPYWLNVVRFYAGFYNSGQLPSLVTRLRAMQSNPDWQLTDRPRTLATMLLGDGSFAMERQSREAAVELVLEDLGHRHALTAQAEGMFAPSVMTLPAGAGQPELLERCWNLLDDPDLPGDRRSAIQSLMAVLGPAARAGWQERTGATSGDERTRWLEMGWATGLLRGLNVADRELLWSDGAADQYGVRAALAINSGFAAEVEREEKLSRAFVDALLHGSISLGFNEEGSSSLGVLGAILQPIGGYEHIFWHHSAQLMPRPGRPRRHISPTAASVADIVRECLAHFKKNPRREDLIPQLFAAVEQTFGGGWGLERSSLELIAGRGRPSRSGVAQDLADSSRPLLERLRYARYRGGQTNGAWWRRQLQAASSPEEVRIALITALSWPVEDALGETIGVAGHLLERLENEDLSRVYDLVKRLGWSRGRGRRPRLSPAQMDDIPLRAGVALGWRDPEGFGQSLLSERLSSYRGNDTEVLRFCLELGTVAVVTGANKNLTLIRRSYRRVPDGVGLARRETSRGLDLSLARQIVKNASDYPLLAVRAAEERCTAKAGAALPPLRQVAEEERWFAE